MRTKEEFNRYYEQELRVQAEQLERQRQIQQPGLRKRRHQSIGVTAVFLLLVFILFQGYLWNMFPLLLVGVIAIYYLFYYRYVQRLQERLSIQVKQSLLPDLIAFIDPNLVYRPQESILRQDFLASHLFDEHTVDIYTGDDLIQGAIGETNVQFSELHVQERYEDSEGKTRYRTTFKGLFFVADFNKPFHGSLYALPKAVKSDFLSQFMGTRKNATGDKMERVVLENSDFQDAFLVRATDQVLARYVLTPTFMEALLRFKEASEYEPKFSFCDGVMYLALQTNRAHLEFDLKKGIDKAVVATYFEDIHLSLQIVEELQLNNRLWG